MRFLQETSIFSFFQMSVKFRSYRWSSTIHFFHRSFIDLSWVHPVNASVFFLFSQIKVDVSAKRGCNFLIEPCDFSPVSSLFPVHSRQLRVQLEALLRWPCPMIHSSISIHLSLPIAFSFSDGQFWRTPVENVFDHQSHSAVAQWVLKCVCEIQALHRSLSVALGRFSSAALECRQCPFVRAS